MPSNAKANFDANKEDVDRLWQIHQEVAGGGPGRKRDVEVLNRAALVFITACWESYVEDVVREAFAFMVEQAPSAAAIPPKIKAFLARRLRESPNPLEDWALADEGWRDKLRSYSAEVELKWTGSFNTPKPEQVKGLFEEMLGMPDITKYWKWKKMTSVKAKEKLENYVTLRGDIAHRLASDSAVYKADGLGYLNHVSRLAEESDEAVRAHIEGVTGKSPW